MQCSRLTVLTYLTNYSAIGCIHCLEYLASIKQNEESGSYKQCQERTKMNILLVGGRKDHDDV